MSSSPSNLGPSNPELLQEIRRRLRLYRAENGLHPSQEVPADAVTASGSGLDPMISPENARLQAQRVARAREMTLDQVLALVRANTTGRSLGFLGEPGVNVLELNLALDKQA
jgi:K+-transporting ATPase ATPase C chain